MAGGEHATVAPPRPPERESPESPAQSAHLHLDGVGMSVWGLGSGIQGVRSRI